jgi:hypothetical protein
MTAILGCSLAELRSFSQIGPACDLRYFHLQSLLFPAMRNAKTPGPAAAANVYSASVPISLYREVSADLQSHQATMTALKKQNQQLLHQNQQLRQEIDRVILAVAQMRQSVVNLPSVNLELPAEVPHIEVMPARVPHSFKGNALSSPLTSDELVIEQAPLRRKMQAEKPATEQNGWWLGLVICLIVITAFGTGFLIVRPLLQSGK